MEHLKKNPELVSIISSFSSLLFITLFLVTLYTSDHMLTGDHSSNAYKNAAAIIPTIIFSVMFGAMLMTIILSTLRMIVKKMNQGKVKLTEPNTNALFLPFFLNTKLLNIFVLIGIISLAVSIALSIDYGGFASVVVFGVMLGILLFSYFYLYLEIKQQKAKANEAFGNA